MDLGVIVQGCGSGSRCHSPRVLGLDLGVIVQGCGVGSRCHSPRVWEWI